MWHDHFSPLREGGCVTPHPDSRARRQWLPRPTVVAKVVRVHLPCRAATQVDCDRDAADVGQPVGVRRQLLFGKPYGRTAFSAKGGWGLERAAHGRRQHHRQEGKVTLATHDVINSDRASASPARSTLLARASGLLESLCPLKQRILISVHNQVQVGGTRCACPRAIPFKSRQSRTIACKYCA